MFCQAVCYSTVSMESAMRILEMAHSGMAARCLSVPRRRRCSRHSPALRRSPRQGCRNMRLPEHFDLGEVLRHRRGRWDFWKSLFYRPIPHISAKCFQNFFVCFLSFDKNIFPEVSSVFAIFEKWKMRLKNPTRGHLACGIKLCPFSYAACSGVFHPGAVYAL